ncbi:MAG: DUF488 family protein [Thermoanaerobaculia bacterium]
MALHVVRLGSRREPGEGPRLGTVRRPPRGVRKEEIARRDFYDVWLPELSPSAELVQSAHEADTEARWRAFARRYRREMNQPAARHLIELLAALSRSTELALGCYCENEARCHRSLLRELLAEAGARIA